MKRNTTIIMGAVVIVLAVAGISAYLLTSQPKVKEFKLELLDYGYNGSSGGPTLRVKAGDVVKVTLINKSERVHEFRLSSNMDKFLSDVDKVVANLQAQGLKTADQVDSAQAFKDARRLTGMKLVMVNNALDWDTDVDPGKTVTIQFSIDTPGTYWYLCGELDGTFPQTHTHKSMFGQIIVER